MFRCNYGALRDLRLRLREEAGKILLNQCAQILTRRLIDEAMARTPVRTGKLRAGFSSPSLSDATGNSAAGGVFAQIVNNVEYASFVELGHRTRSGGFVPGRFMLTLAAMETLNQAPDLVAETVGAFLKECFAGGS